MTELALQCWPVVTGIVDPVVRESQLLLQIVDHKSVGLLVLEILRAAHSELRVVNRFLFWSHLLFQEGINSTPIMACLGLCTALEQANVVHNCLQLAFFSSKLSLQILLLLRLRSRGLRRCVQLRMHSHRRIG